MHHPTIGRSRRAVCNGLADRRRGARVSTA